MPASSAAHTGTISTAATLWFHADTQAALDKLAALWQGVAPDLPATSLILTWPAELAANVGALARCNPMALPVSWDSTTIASIFGSTKPCAALMIVRALSPAMLRLTKELGCPLLLADADYPRVSGLWGYVPWARAQLTRNIARVFVPSAEYQRPWLQAGLEPERIVPSGWLSSAPHALPVNEAEREALTDALRQRTVWLAIGVPEDEEGYVLAALRETLRESHRSVLILHPIDQARGATLKAELGERFVTALRSVDDPITPETQVYIPDTDGERGLWYRLAVACYLGGSLGPGGATYTPYDAANLGCAIVHGREAGKHAEAFGRLGNAQATRRILRPDALGRAMCATLRPDAAALLAGRAWDVVSDGADAFEAISLCLKSYIRGTHASS